MSGNRKKTIEQKLYWIFAFIKWEKSPIIITKSSSDSLKKNETKHRIITNEILTKIIIRLWNMSLFLEPLWKRDKPILYKWVPADSIIILGDNSFEASKWRFESINDLTTLNIVLE